MKRLSEYIHFVHSQHETQDKCILRGVLWQNTPPWSPEITHRGGGGYLYGFVKLFQYIYGVTHKNKNLDFKDNLSEIRD